MYMPPQFNATDPLVAADLMRSYSFASLISVDEAGLPFVTHLPLHLEQHRVAEAGGEAWVLLGHVARANPHWRYLQARRQALVTFMGPHAYLSPRVYPDLMRVPSWNYLAVHCTVQARLMDEPKEKEAMLQKLISDHEPAYAAQWQALQADFQQKMLSALVAFELQITAWQCKLKLNQHRPESHASMHQSYAAGSEDEQALAHWLVRLGLRPAT